MRIIVDCDDLELLIDLSRGHDISIPVRFSGPRFRAFGADAARVEAYRVGSQRLEVSDGAGCNCPVFDFSAHLHGTHTECVGHITSEPYLIQETAPPPPFVSALLVTVVPVTKLDCDEAYLPFSKTDDLIISRQVLEEAVGGRDWSHNFSALLVRTIPNEGKKTRNYDREPAPYFSNDAMTYINQLGVKLLLVDMPSVDRLEDDGQLSNHHIFWGVEQGQHSVKNPSEKSITELICVDDSVKDGMYLLNLNIANIYSDAAPSQAILYEVIES